MLILSTDPWHMDLTNTSKLPFFSVSLSTLSFVQEDLSHSFFLMIEHTWKEERIEVKRFAKEIGEIMSFTNIMHLANSDIVIYKNNWFWSWRGGSVVECMTSMHGALDWIPSPTNRNKNPDPSRLHGDLSMHNFIL